MKNKAYLLPACKTADGVPIGIGSEVYAITFKQKVNKYGRLYRPSTRELAVVKVTWSREAPPCHITMVGSHHPLREPDLHLSMYPALLSFGQQLLTGCGLQHGIFCTQPAFYAVLQSLQPPMPACP